MMMARLCILICEQFYAELAEAIKQSAHADIVTASFASRCGRPPTEKNELEKIIQDCEPCSKTIVLGSCCIAQLTDCIPESPDLQLISNRQCFYPFADKAIIEHWLQQGSYLLTPGWLKNWQNNIKNMGFNQRTAPEFFNGFAKQLVFLDTGIEPAATDMLIAFANFVDLPYQHMKLGLDYFELYLNNMILEWRLEQQKTNQQHNQQQKQREIASYAMAMDLVNQLARTMEQQQAIETIGSVFIMLFGAEQVNYLDKQSSELKQYEHLLTAAKDKNYAQLESNNGFLLRVATDNRYFGWILISQLAFPEYQRHYLNLALTLVQVFGLAIENAQTYEAIKNAEQSLRVSNQELENTIDRLQKTQQQLIESEKMASLGRLVSGVAHEINTPLGVSMTAASSLLQRSEKLSTLFESKRMKYSDLQVYLQTATEAERLVLNNLQRIGELIKTFKQLSIDQHIGRNYTFRIKQYIEDIILSLKHQLSKKSIKIIVNCDDQLSINSNPSIFAQILSNFLINSLKHGFKDQAQGEIEINVNKQQAQLIIDYRDNGCGIEDAVLPKIFDPFFSTNLQQGSGLGLHIVYNLVTQKLDGTVLSDSVVGEGTHFQLVLPLQELPEK